MVTELLVSLRKLSDKSLVDKADVQVGKVAYNRFVAFNDLGYYDFQSANLMRFFRLLLLQTDVFNFLAALDILFDTFFLFLLEKVIVLRIYFADVLISFHIFLRLVKAHGKVVTKIIKDTFSLEINATRLFILD